MAGEVLFDPVDSAAEEMLHTVSALELRPAAGANHEAVFPCWIVLLVADRQDDLRHGGHGGRRRRGGWLIRRENQDYVAGSGRLVALFPVVSPAAG